MDRNRIFSGALRLVAVVGALTALVSQNPPAGAAAPAVLPSPFIPVSGLAAYWALDETAATTVEDWSGNSNNGSYYNTPVISTDVAPVPAVGNLRSLKFTANGSTQRVNVPDSASLRISGKMTVAAWLKPTADTPLYHKGTIEKWTDGATDIDGYMLRLGYPDKGNNVPAFTLGNGATRLTVDNGFPIPNDQWTHVAAVYDGANMIMYVGGVSVATTPNAGAVVPTAANTNELHIGSDYGTEVFTGNIDEARIFNRDLSAVEVGILKDGQQPPTLVSATAIAGGNQISWTAPAVPSTGLTYSLLIGTSAGTYTSVINGITGTSYDHLAATPGVPTHYAVVAVSVMTSVPTADVSSTPGPAGPPPPPPPPRTQKLGERHMCGCDTVSSTSGLGGLLGAALMAAALGTASLRRRGRA